MPALEPHHPKATPKPRTRSRLHPGTGPRPGAEAWRAWRAWWGSWWQIVLLAAQVAAQVAAWMLGRRPRGSVAGHRNGWPRLARHLVWATAPVLPWFCVVSALLSLVIARIVIVTAASYGLDQYALGMVVRVLVLELIPLAAALFVAVRITVPDAAALAALRHNGGFDALRAAGGDPLRDELAPRVVAGLLGVLLLAALASVITLVLAYLLVHGLSPWGFERFTRQVGQVFSPAVTLIFVLKTLAFGAAVSVVPLGSALHDRKTQRADGAAMPLALQGLVRLLTALLLVEMASLVGNYA